MIASKGATFVDAPVSGGVPGAANATLCFMVGGTPEEYNTVKPVLECMGVKITHCGGYGMGQAAKVNMEFSRYFLLLFYKHLYFPRFAIT